MKIQTLSPSALIRALAFLIFLPILLAQQPTFAQENQFFVYLPLVLKPVPPITVLIATADVEVHNDIYKNHGGELSMRVGFHSDSYRSLVRFPIEKLSSQCLLISAEILVYYYGFYDKPGQSRTITMYRMDGSWDEMEVTGSMAPEHGETVGSLQLPPEMASFGYHGFDALELVSKWLSREHPNYGVLLAGTGSSDSKAYRRFYTREGAHPPKLIVECSSNQPGVNNPDP